MPRVFNIIADDLGASSSERRTLVFVPNRPVISRLADGMGMPDLIAFFALPEVAKALRDEMGTIEVPPSRDIVAVAGVTGYPWVEDEEDSLDEEDLSAREKERCFRSFPDMRQLSLSSVKKIRQAASLDGSSKYLNENEKLEWDKWYSIVDKLRWIDEVHPRVNFRHGVVHDAESVFYLLILFFNRICTARGADDVRGSGAVMMRGVIFRQLARKRPGDDCSLPFMRSLEPRGLHASFYNVLSAINEYLYIPWYNVQMTQRHERYEFHLHDFMQRLIFKEIQIMRDSRVKMTVEPTPLPVLVQGWLPGEFISSCAEDGIVFKHTRILLPILIGFRRRKMAIYRKPMMSKEPIAQELGQSFLTLEARSRR